MLNPNPIMSFGNHAPCGHMQNKKRTCISRIKILDIRGQDGSRLNCQIFPDIHSIQSNSKRFTFEWFSRGGKLFSGYWYRDTFWIHVPKRDNGTLKYPQQQEVFQMQLISITDQRAGITVNVVSPIQNAHYCMYSFILSILYLNRTCNCWVTAFTGRVDPDSVFPLLINKIDIC